MVPVSWKVQSKKVQQLNLWKENKEYTKNLYEQFFFCLTAYKTKWEIINKFEFMNDVS